MKKFFCAICLMTLVGSVSAQTDDVVVIGFENQTLNESNYWIGGEDGELVEGQWGNTWTCKYTEGVATVTTTYGGYYWSGFAISACTGTTFTDAYAGADQYNCVVGKAKSGNNFLVAQQAYGIECISFSEPVTVNGFSYTNSAVAVNSIVNGDDYEAPFTKEDWLKCTVIATRSNSSTVTFDIDLAKDGDYVKTWQTTEGMEKVFTDVVSLSFAFSGSRNGEWGLNTPAYFCMDDLEVTPSTAHIATLSDSNHTVVARYDLGGRRMQQRGKGFSVVRLDNGKVFKVVTK